MYVYTYVSYGQVQECIYTHVTRQSHRTVFGNKINNWKLHNNNIKPLPLFAFEFNANVVCANLIPVDLCACDGQRTTKSLEGCLTHCLVVVTQSRLDPVAGGGGGGGGG